MNIGMLAQIAFIFLLCSAFTCGKKQDEPSLPSKSEAVSISPLSDEFMPSKQINEQFEIHVGGCGEDPDLVSDFNHYTATNQKVVEKYGLSVHVDKVSKRCGYTLRKGQDKLDLEWSDFDSFWQQFRTFYHLTD